MPVNVSKQTNIKTYYKNIAKVNPTDLKHQEIKNNCSKIKKKIII